MARCPRRAEDVRSDRDRDRLRERIGVGEAEVPLRHAGSGGHLGADRSSAIDGAPASSRTTSISANPIDDMP